MSEKSNLQLTRFFEHVIRVFGYLEDSVQYVVDPLFRRKTNQERAFLKARKQLVSMMTIKGQLDAEISAFREQYLSIEAQQLSLSDLEPKILKMKAELFARKMRSADAKLDYYIAHFNGSENGLDQKIKGLRETVIERNEFIQLAKEGADRRLSEEAVIYEESMLLHISKLEALRDKLVADGRFGRFD